jgi:hypothetical protein
MLGTHFHVALRVATTIVVVLAAVIVVPPPVAQGLSFTRTLDSTGIVGEGISLELTASGNPVVSYYDTTNGDLKLAICSDATCSAAPTLRTLDSVGNVGESTSLELTASGNPVVSYYARGSEDLKLAVCSNPTCSTAPTLRTLDSTGNVGGYTSLVLNSSGNPVVSYYDSTNGDLKLAVCGDLTCSTPPALRTLDSAGIVGRDTSLVLNSSGNPVVSYTDLTNSDLKLAICSNSTCSTAPTLRTLDSAGAVGFNTSLVLNSSGNPVVSYYDSTNGDLKLAICSNSTCSTTPTLRTLDGANAVGLDTSLVLTSSGNPVVSYFDTTNDDLKLAVCGDPTCLSVSARILDSAGNVGQFTSLALSSTGNPVVSYRDSTNSDVKLYTDDVPMSPVTQFDPTGALTGITLQPTYSWSRAATANVYTLVLYEFAGTPTLKHIEAINGFSACNFVTNLCAYKPTAPGATLRNGVIYGWWIIPGNETGNGPWSAGKAFASFVKPANPVMVTPAIGSTQSTTPIYRWNRVDGAFFYTVLVLRASDAAVMFNQSIAASTCTVDPCQLTQTPALAAGSYIWYVIALNPAGNSDYVGVPFSVVGAQPQVAPTFAPVE